MKVLLFNGSPREAGNTATALKEIAARLKVYNIDSEIVWIGKTAVRGCIGCGACKKVGKNRCVFTDDVCNTVIEKMESCDALVIGAPVYWGQPAAQAMAIQQRMLVAGYGAFAGKPSAAVCVCRRGGATAAFQALQMPFQMINCPIVTSQYWNIAYGREEGQAAQDDEGMQTMRKLADNLATMLQKFATGTATPAPAEERVMTSMIR